MLHPTGYPIYILLGHAFVVLIHRLGAGFPFAANAWAALGGGVGLFLYHRLALRLLPARTGLSRLERFVLAALPVLLLGFNPVWMVECTVVEVHSWQLAWLFGTTLSFVGLVEALERPDAPVPHLPRRMLAWGFLCGAAPTTLPPCSSRADSRSRWAGRWRARSDFTRGCRSPGSWPERSRC